MLFNSWLRLRDDTKSKDGVEEGEAIEFSMFTVFVEVSLRSDVKHGALLMPLAFLDSL